METHPQFKQSFSLNDLKIAQYAEDEAANLNYAINPNFDSIMPDIFDFANKYGMDIADFQNTLTMTPYLYPDAGPERLLAISNLMTILFFIDDTLGEHPDLFDGLEPSFITQRIVRTLSGDTSDGLFIPTSIESSIYEILPELVRLSNNDFIQRFLQSAKEYLPENVNLDSSIGEDLMGYILQRILNSGMMPTIDLAELATNKYLPKEFFDPNNPEFEIIRNLREVVAKIGSLTNDLFSFPKEFYDANSKLNIVAVIHNTNSDMSIEDAFKLGIIFVNNELEKFKEICNDIKESYEGTELEETMNNYAKKMKYIVLATYFWQLITNRYKHVLHPFKEMRPNAA
ncbi:MAG: hypothetical protein ABIM99_01500 [Candidatus Dojkabacteria bacterium]